MKSIKIKKLNQALTGELSFPGDKSLTHRAIIFGALAEGESSFTNMLPAEDCVCTRKAFESLGVGIQTLSPTHLKIAGKGLRALTAPKKPLDLGNSGTAMRLLLGVLAGNPFQATLTGDPSLSSRPMGRVTELLRKMGAAFEGRENAHFAPITVKGARLKGIDVKLPIASAQVKSALLLAGLYAEGETRVTEPVKSRDHTEKFLNYFGAKIKEEGLSVSIRGPQRLQAKSFEIAGDISSAAFMMAASLLVPGSKVGFRSVLWNPTRTGIINVLKRMGVKLDIQKIVKSGPEETADFTMGVFNTPLRSFEIKKEELPSLIDEVPILAVLATQAQGISVIHDAAELRVKETDRIYSMVSQLSKMGAKISAKGDSLFIEGPTPLHGSTVESFKDHRTAMSLVIAGMIADGQTLVEDVDCIDTSFPNFFELLGKLGVSGQQC